MVLHLQPEPAQQLFLPKRLRKIKSGNDKNFVWAKAYISGDKVIVYSDRVENPVAVRYDWSNNPDGNLYNKEGLPACPFRTDIWEISSEKK